MSHRHQLRFQLVPLTGKAGIDDGHPCLVPDQVDVDKVGPDSMK
jgi:hypothetical protein